MSITRNSFRRPAALFAAAAVLMGAAAPALFSVQHASAALVYVQSRSIKMSDATPGATNVKYTVSFNVATTGVIQGVDVDFCGGANTGSSDTPLYADSNCTLAPGMNIAGVGVTSPVTGLSPTTGWSATVINSGHTVEVANASGVSVSSPTTVSFELTGITNPTYATGRTFYARILTFSTTAASAAYTSGSSAVGQTDFGGIALSTVPAVNITARVQETLLFCVSHAVPTADCTGLDAPALNIGKPVGTNFVLDSASVYTDSAHTQVSSNALHGVVVRMKTTSSATCAGLSSDGGTTCTSIPAVTSGATTATTISAGTAAFGMCVTPTAGTTATTPYDSSGCTQYGMDDSSATKTTSTYGSQIFSSAAPVNNVGDTLTYAATASNTTPAGIYSTTQSLIATGVF